MALIKCDECGNMISDKAVSCPHCGYPTHLNQQAQAPEEPAVEALVEDAPADTVIHTNTVVRPEVEAEIPPMPAEPVAAATEPDPLEPPTEQVPKQADQSTAPDESKIKAKERKSLWIVLIVFIALIVLALVGALIYNNGKGGSQDDTGVNPTDSVEAAARTDSTDTYVNPKTGGIKPYKPSRQKGTESAPESKPEASQGAPKAPADPVLVGKPSDPGAGGSGHKEGSSDKRKEQIKNKINPLVQ